MTLRAAGIFRCLAYLPLAAATVPNAGQAQQIGLESHRDAEWTFHHENVLGTSLEVTLRAGSEGQAAAAEAALLAAIERHDAILSAWKSDSELSQWLATSGEEKKVSAELLEVLGLFDSWRDRTAGALDASAESAMRLWKRAAAGGRQPT